MNQKKSNKKKNKKGLQNQESQPQESHPTSANDSTNDEKKIENYEPKGININDFVLNYNFDYLDFDHVEVLSEYENDIKVLIAKLSILTTT